VYTILAGGYTNAIATYQFDAGRGTLKYISQSNSGANPSWIALHPTNHSIL
jgi:6-phosphogluconolactonase (cycloisomerase 2 family)